VPIPMPSFGSSERRYLLLPLPGVCELARVELGALAPMGLCALLCLGVTTLAPFLPRVLSLLSSASRPSVGCSGGRAHAGSLYVKLSMSIVPRYLLTRCLSPQAIASVIAPAATDATAHVYAGVPSPSSPLRACYARCKQSWPIAHRLGRCRTVLTAGALRCG